MEKFKKDGKKIICQQCKTIPHLSIKDTPPDKITINCLCGERAISVSEI